jgi:hypothetical protein
MNSRDKIVRNTRPSLLANQRASYTRKRKDVSQRKIINIPASNIRSVHIPGPGERHLVEKITRWIDGGAVYPQTAAVGTSYVFKLSQLPGYTELQNMYDFFRFTKIDVVYHPASMTGPATATTTSPGTVMAACADFDESVAVSFSTLLERQDTQVYSVFKPWEVSFEPRASVLVYGNGVTSGYALANKGEWMDTSSDPSYYGFNYAFPATAAAMQFGGRITYRVHVELAKVI